MRHLSTPGRREDGLLASGQEPCQEGTQDMTATLSTVTRMTCIGSRLVEWGVTGLLAVPGDTRDSGPLLGRLVSHRTIGW
jgi:hypothetical protein